MTRNALIDHLKSRDIGTSVHYMPLHLHPYYRDRYCLRPEHFPVATSLFDEVISMPLYPGMTDSQLARVCAEISAAARPRWPTTAAEARLGRERSGRKSGVNRRPPPPPCLLAVDAATSAWLLRKALPTPRLADDRALWRAVRGRL